MSTSTEIDRVIKGFYCILLWYALFTYVTFCLVCGTYGMMHQDDGSKASHEVARSSGTNQTLFFVLQLHRKTAVWIHTSITKFWNIVFCKCRTLMQSLMNNAPAFLLKPFDTHYVHNCHEFKLLTWLNGTQHILIIHRCFWLIALLNYVKCKPFVAREIYTFIDLFW